jgi:GNAT superfamily N-acetyltransferase
MDISIREAVSGDIPEILRQRQGMYRDMDYDDDAALAGMIAACEPYLAEAIRRGSFRGWLALSQSRIVGGGGVIVNPWLSHPYDLQCRRATILNVYVYPEFRRCGVGRCLMQTMIEWCKAEKFAAVYLHASKDGLKLYQSLGFDATTEMQLKLRS